MSGALWSLGTLSLFVVHVTCSLRCGSSTWRLDVIIPPPMRIEDLLAANLDQYLPQMYYGLYQPTAYQPDMNFYSRITQRSSNLFYQDSTGDFTDGNGVTSCSRRSENLTLIADGLAAFHHTDNNQRTMMYWSSCPSSYIWSLRCTEWIPPSNRCRLEKAEIGVNIVNGLDDLPLDSLASDLCQTGIKFSTTDFQWSFVYGKNNLC